MDPNIIILAAGASSRMKASAAAILTTDPVLSRDVEEKPKAMIGIGERRRPFLDYLLDNVEDAGYHDVVIVVGEGDATIRQYYAVDNGAAQYPALDISYAVQKLPEGRSKPLGTADAVLEALNAKQEWKGKKFTVCNSDNLYSVKALKLLVEDFHDNAMIDYDRSALKFGYERIEQFAIITKDNEGYLQNIIEKPSAEEIKHAADLSGRIGVSMNIFRFSYDDIHPFLENVPMHPVRHEKELPVAVKMMVVHQPQAMFAIPRSEHVPDLTVQSDILEVKSYLKEKS
jgi:NDP-sugar pyrophosphorylase family protein